MKGKKVGEIKLDESLFDYNVNKAVLHQAVVMYGANKRSGTASTKTRKNVSGGGKKPWRQKGTGRARTGSIRNPIWRGGGIVFGPHPRDYSYNIPSGIKKVALKSSLNVKLADEALHVLDKVELGEPKTKLFQKVLDNLKIKTSALVILDKVDENIKRATRNIPLLTVKRDRDANAMDVLSHTKLIITESALKNLQKRLT